ncbi:MAG: hypothetical protein PVH88_26280 [Ignavibacteria bacterium]|jgi:hypothetical protein
MLKNIITILFFVLIFNSKAAAQTESVEISAKLLLKIVRQAETHVMFNMKGGRLYVLDQDRNALLPKNYKAPDDEVYYVYSVDDVLNYIKLTMTKKIRFVKNSSGVIMGDDTAKSLVMPPHCPPQCF